MSDDTSFTVSSGNVFADIGVADPDVALAKAGLARQLIAAINERNLTQAAAGELLGINQPKVSAIMRGRLREFSIDRLMHLLTRLNLDVGISVTPSSSPASTVGRIAIIEDCWPGQDLPMAAKSIKKDGVQFS